MLSREWAAATVFGARRGGRVVWRGRARAALLLIALVGSWQLGFADLPAATPAAAQVAPAAEQCGPPSLIADFEARDGLPQGVIAEHEWYARNWNGGWGPRAAAYPVVEAPPGCDPVVWKRARVVAVARRYLGLPYRHHHIPAWDPPAWLSGGERAGAGLDCSNYTAWVYNYGLGIQFTSNVQKQADGPLAPGRLLAPGEPFVPGDLLFILRGNRADISHVVIYVDENSVIDSGGGFGAVTEHPMQGWYLTHYSHARRVIE